VGVPSLKDSDVFQLLVFLVRVASRRPTAARAPARFSASHGAISAARRSRSGSFAHHRP